MRKKTLSETERIYISLVAAEWCFGGAGIKVGSNMIKMIRTCAGNVLNSAVGKIAPRDCNKVSLLVVRRENLFYEQAYKTFFIGCCDSNLL